MPGDYNQDEITPEMLEAGRSIVEAWDYDSPSLSASTHSDFAKLVYLAMRRCEPTKRHKQPE